MDLIQLRYFMRVVELRSVTKAAASLHVAQSAVTRQVRLLEEELGVELFLRHSRGTDPTSAGMRLFAGADAAFHILTHTKADVAAANAEVSGTVRIGLPPSLGVLVGADAAVAFRAAHPTVRIGLVEGYSLAICRKLEDDELDLALITGLDQNPLLVKTHLCDERLWLVQRPSASARVRGRASVTLRDLDGLSLVQPSENNTTRQLIHTAAASSGIELKVAIEVESFDLMKRLVMRGIGDLVMPYSAVYREVQAGELVGAPVEGLSVSRYLARRADRAPSRALVIFRETLLGCLEAASRAAGGNITLAAPAGAAG